MTMHRSLYTIKGGGGVSASGRFGLEQHCMVTKFIKVAIFKHTVHIGNDSIYHQCPAN